ncbi:MAG: hypothetical protein QNK23_09770 [Crocinitomicaceae bacterium]|nr:hypothetical protein [Crocinitomicaceae bacterium]
MKNVFLIGGVLAILFNSLAGIILNDFSTYNWILADVNILATTGLIYALYSHFLDNAFKTAFSFLFFLSGFARYVLSLIAPSETENNWIILLIGGILFIETFIFIFGVALKKK